MGLEKKLLKLLMKQIFIQKKEKKELDQWSNYALIGAYQDKEHGVSLYQYLFQKKQVNH